MEQTNDNPYSTPKSDVVPANQTKGIHNFKRFSAWGVLGLSIITFGIYTFYWIYSRVTTLNSFHENKISSTLLTAFIVFLIASFFSEFANTGSGIMEIAYIAVNLIYVVLYLVVLFTLRSRLQDITHNHIGPVLTFFFSVIYLQYKINQSIDEETQ